MTWDAVTHRQVFPSDCIITKDQKQGKCLSVGAGWVDYSTSTRQKKKEWGRHLCEHRSKGFCCLHTAILRRWCLGHMGHMAGVRTTSLKMQTCSLKLAVPFYNPVCGIGEFQKPHPCHHLVQSMFLIWATQLGIQWYAIVVLVCISLMMDILSCTYFPFIGPLWWNVFSNLLTIF